MDIINNRVGRFTSSEVWKLLKEGKKAGTFGEKALTYIEEKKYERELGRSINGNAFSHATSYGNFMETYVFNIHLGSEYVFQSKEVIIHPTISYFAGSPDFTTNTIISDCKAPFTLLSFCRLVNNCTMGVEKFKKEHESFYWQLIANSILTNKQEIELIVFCPYYGELAKIFEFNETFDWEENGYSPVEFEWINNAILRDNGQLPYLIEGNKYTNINKFRFAIPAGEKEFLTEKVEMAILEL